MSIDKAQEILKILGGSMCELPILESSMGYQVEVGMGIFSRTFDFRHQAEDYATEIAPAMSIVRTFLGDDAETARASRMLDVVEVLLRGDPYVSAANISNLKELNLPQEVLDILW